MKTGSELIREERTRQVEKEGWSESHDDNEHMDGQLISAAVCYATHAQSYGHLAGDVDITVYQRLMPKSVSWPWLSKWWKPKDPIRDLVRAGALIAAEIDRLQRDI